MTSDVRMALVPQLHVMDVWLKALPHLMNGKEHWEMFFSIEQIRKNLVTGKQQLWILIQDENKVIAAAITQLDSFPERTVLRIAYIGGKGLKRGMMKELKTIEYWARGKGATLVDILGRKEWGKLLAEHDYTVPGVVFRKELN